MTPAHWLCGSVGEGSEKGQWPLPTFLSGRKLSLSSHLDARCFTSSMYATCAIQAAPQCLSSEGVNLSKLMYGFFKRHCLGVQKFLPLSQSPLVFATRSYGYLSFWHWNPGLGEPGVWLGLFAPKISLLNFYLPHMDLGPVPCTSLTLPPIWMDVVSLIL